MINFMNTRIKPEAILRATWVNFKTGQYSQGGSAITQQVIKNALLARKSDHKKKRMDLALKLEREMNKEQILTLYLNEALIDIYGVESCSEFW